MSQTVADIIDVMEAMAPGDLAESWDNAGLQVGSMDWPVRTMWVALDPAPKVVEAACRQSVDLLVTHHPLIFRQLKCVNFDTPVGRIIAMAAKHRTAVFSAHTNYDAAVDGLNDILADRIGLVTHRVLSPHPNDPNQGFGRIGPLSAATTLKELAVQVRDAMGLETVRFAGRDDLPVYRAAVCTGSGGGLMEIFYSSGAEAFITGDVRYHDARNAEWTQTGIIDIGHFASEHLMVGSLAARLRETFKAKGFDVKVAACDLEEDPFDVV